MIDTISLVKYGLAALSVFLLGTAAGAFVKHQPGASLELPMALALCGIVAAVVAWRLHRRAAGPKK
jgi:hypothetical protein